MKCHRRCVLVFLTFAHLAYGADILGFFPIGGSSHYQPQEVLLKALAARGHNVTVVTSFPQKAPVKNLHDIDVSATKGHAMNTLPFKVVTTQLQSTSKNLNFIANLSRTYCEAAFSYPAVQNLLSSDRKFDLVITEIFGADCAAGFAWKHKAPLVSILTSRRTPWALSRVGNPENPAYMPMMQTQFSSRMTFAERLVNTFWYLYFSFLYEYSFNTGETDEISRKFFGPDVPPVNDIVYNTSLVFVNNHYTIDQAYPMVPNFIEIAGIHVKKPKPLPANLQKFMDEAKHGVIYFTLGSLVRVSTLPNETIRAFRDAFAELPQKVLWKFELELQDIPPNVIISKWFPQTDIFGHPNTKVFISHGGNLGTIEAVHFGIPMVGIPLYFDQYKNIQSYVDKGVAVRLSMAELTKENILAAVRTVATDKGYSERMKKLSQLFRDRPMSPVDTAVYWVEYVLRHKGAHHLRTAGSKMPWYQYYLLDVISLCLAVFCILLYAVGRITAIIYTCIRNTFFSRKLKTN